MSAEDQAILVDQIAQAAIVELSAMRDELASAQLDSENLQTLLDQLERDRREIPPAVSAGRIPTFGARERWNRLAETIEDLEVSLDEAFSARINLLSKMPELKADLKTAQTLLGDTDSGLAPSLRQLLEDAADKLQERIDMCDELSEAYRQEVAVAVEAYDVASRYSAELSEAMVEGRSRGLEARVPGRLSLHTARALAEDIGKLPAVAPQLATTYCDQGNCPQTILATSLRILAVVLLIWLAVHGWKQTPGWIYTIAETYLGNTDADDN